MALSRSRVTPSLAFFGAMVAAFNFPVNGGSTLYSGGLMCLNSEGNVVPGSAATGLIALGKLIDGSDVDNSAGADGAKRANVQAGVHRWANSAAADEITAAEIGDVCYIVDDQTVAKTDNGATRSAAGIISNVDAAGVWVASGFNMFAQPAPTAGGSFILQKTLTVPFNHAQLLAEGDDGDAVDINVGTALPDNAVLIGARYKITIPFVGAGLATLTMMVGFAGDTNGVIEAVDILGDAAAEYRGVPGTAMGGPAGLKQLVANFDPDGAAGLDELTAGSVKIDVFYFVQA